MVKKFPRGHWKNFENVRAPLAPIVAELGRMPTVGELTKRGLAKLVRAAYNHYGGLDDIARRMDTTRSTNRYPHGHWRDIENVRAILVPLSSEIGRMPTESELEERGLTGLTCGMIQYHGGIMAVQRALGLEGIRRQLPNGHWQDFENLRGAIEPIATELGRMPRTSELSERGLSSVSVAINAFHGGMPAVTRRLGLGPVTDEAIASHADALAKIVPALDANSTRLWARMKRSWTKRDLDAAIAEHAATGSIERFEQLLAS